jgi:hypothetical protein
MNQDAQGQIVLDSIGNPMEVGKYYNIEHFSNVKYLGQRIDNKNLMRFQIQTGRIIRRIIEPLAIDRPHRVEPLEEGNIDTDNEDQLDTGYGGKRKSKRRRSKRRKNKGCKTKRRRHSSKRR